MNLFQKCILASCLLLSCSTAFAKPIAGETAPTIEAKALNGTSINTNKIGKKGLEIVFLDSLCPMPNFPKCEENLNKLKESIAQKPKVQWIGVMNSYYVDQAYATEWLTNFGFEFPVVFDTNNKIFKEYGVFATPYRVSISNKGIITERGAVK